MNLFIDYLTQVGIAADQFINALIPPLDGTLSYSDETLSARSYRAWRDGRIMGRMMPFIDWLYTWQKPDPLIKNDVGEIVVGHCQRAYYKERLRRGLPPEYRVSPNA